MRHRDITGYNAIHVPWFVGGTDPALDTDNAVAAHKSWWDTSEQRLKIRNANNTQWIYFGEDVGGL